MALHCPDSLTAVAGFYNQFSPSKLDRLGDTYSPGISFHDPLRSATGLDQLREVFANRFRKFEGAALAVVDAHGDDRTGFFQWNVKYRHRGEERVLHAISHCKFANDGRIREQRDCWDASALVFSNAPLLGRLYEFLKRRAMNS